MYLVLTLIFLRCLSFVEGQALPIAGHSYLLYNMYNGDNPFEYLAWTTSSSDAYQATSDNPGVFMEKTTPNVSPPRSLWTFDLQSDGTYRIYNTDNSYGSTEKRLDVHADGSTPFLENDGSNPGQSWQLYDWGDGITFEIYNTYWQKSLDINGGGIRNYPINGPFMNKPSSALEGQRWQLGDSTPTTSVTISSLVIATQTITPPVQTSTLQGNGMTLTTTNTILETQTETVTATVTTEVPKNLDFQRLFVLTITSTITTVYSTSYTYSTIQASTTFIVNSGFATIITATTTTTIFTTTTITTTITTTSTASPTASSPSMASSEMPLTTTSLPTSTTDPSTKTSSPPPDTTAPSSTDTPATGLTRDQQIGIGVGVPAVVFAAITTWIACWKHCWRDIR